MHAVRLLVVSLPRCGSTSLAAALNCLPGVSVIVEPFHPRRYGGQYFAMAVARSPRDLLNELWRRWTGVKHVYEAGGWPFRGCAQKHEELLSGDRDARIVILQRRNLLQRCISGLICRRVRYWIGDREEFLRRVRSAPLPALSVDAVRLAIARDIAAQNSTLRVVQRGGAPYRVYDYEDLFGVDTTASVLEDLGRFTGLDMSTSRAEHSQARSWFRPESHKWVDAEVYRLIPGIDAVESALGHGSTGFVFR